MNENKLLHRLRAGDESVLPELIRRYSAYAYAIASNILSHALGEEDIRNKARSALRKYHAEDPLEDDVLRISIPNQPEQRILMSELREITHAAVDSLGEPDREIFQRYYFLYQKTEEISEALGLKDATVRARLARGRRRLKDYLKERGFSCEDTHY